MFIKKQIIDKNIFFNEMFLYLDSDPQKKTSPPNSTFTKIKIEYLN